MRYDDGMSVQWFLTLDECSNAHSSHIGERAMFFSSLHQQYIPTPPLICIPTYSLSRVVTETKLEDIVVKALKMTQGLTSDVRKQQLCKAFQTIELPKDWINSLHSLYNHYIGHGFVKVSPSSVLTTTCEQENILGEANLIDSVLSIWGHCVWEANNTRTKGGTVSHITQTPLIIQQQPAALYSGLAYTQNPYTQQKKHLLITARYGEYPHHKSSISHDSYQVDINTLNIVQRSILEQKREYRRIAEGYKQKNLPKIKAQTQKLLDSEIVELAKIVNKLRTQHLQKYVFAWVKTLSGMQITGQLLFEDAMDDDLQAHHNTQTRVKLFISAGNPQKARKQLAQKPDGIGILKSEYTLFSLGTHPRHLVSKEQRNVFKKTVLDTLQTYRDHLGPQKPITYRSHALATAELHQLKHAPVFDKEVNPYLGYRGALEKITQPHFFNLELETLALFLKKSKDPCNLMVSFVRTPIEFRLLYELIKQQELPQIQHFAVWLELSTPENIFNLNHYPLELLQAVSINISQIHALFHGIDPNNHEIVNRYELNHTLISRIFATIQTSLQHFTTQNPTKNLPQFVVHLERYDPHIIESGIKYGVTAFTVKSTFLSTAREHIYTTEAQLLNTGRLTE